MHFIIYNYFAANHFNFSNSFPGIFEILSQLNFLVKHMSRVEFFIEYILFFQLPRCLCYLHIFIPSKLGLFSNQFPTSIISAASLSSFMFTFSFVVVFCTYVLIFHVNPISLHGLYFTLYYYACLFHFFFLISF